MATQVKFLRVDEPAGGLRSRKKTKTRIMIEEAALELFAEQGYEATTVEQIAAKVEISPTTFFRYFPTKADVVLCQDAGLFPHLYQAICDRPASESAMEAVRQAMREIWVPNVDPLHTRRTNQAAAHSVQMRGLYNDLVRTWLEGIAHALAKRKGLSSPDLESFIVARAALGVFNEAMRAWNNGETGESVETMFDRAFATMVRLSAEWARMK